MHWLEYNGCPATGLDSGSEIHLPTALHKVRPATHSKAAAPEGVCIAHGGDPPLVPSSINDQAPVPKAARPAPLALCRLSADTLKLGLGLLGIPSLERMGG